MDYESRLSISYYREIAVINQEHHIYLVQHIETHKFFVKKILDVYNIDIYRYLKENPIEGIPRIYELFEENNQLTIIEDYVSGQTLNEYMQPCGHLSESTALNFILQLCNILEHLHNMSPAIIHRDIKPTNVMITPFDNVVLLDFNAAKYTDSSQNKDTILLGTQGYAAPEQYGFGSSSIQTDIYGLGILFNILLTGKHPSSQKPLSRYASVIDKCIQLRPEDRYSSIGELKAVLLSLSQENSPKAVHPSSQTASFLPPGFRSRNMLHILLAIFGYSCIFWIGSELIVENTTPVTLFIDRVFMILAMLLIVFFSCNYRDIHNTFPFCSSRKNSVRILAIIIVDFLIFMLMVFLMLITESLFL